MVDREGKVLTTWPDYRAKVTWKCCSGITRRNSWQGRDAL